MMLPFARHRSVRGRRRPGWVPIEQLDGSYVALSCVTSVEYALADPESLLKVATDPTISPQIGVDDEGQEGPRTLPSLTSVPPIETA